MGSILKIIKGIGKSFMALPTSTKLKMLSGAAVLIGGGMVIAASAASDDDMLLEGGEIAQALPETDDVIEVQSEMVETEE